MQSSNTNTERVHGIDVLRVALSFCVITIHVLHHGGFRSYADPSGAGFYLFWLLGVSLDCAVNCFAIISGFVLYNQTPKYTNILRLLLTVLYHGILITAVFQRFFPNMVDTDNWIQALFPVSQEEFWYFTSYFGLYFFIPILIQGMWSMSKPQANMLIFSLLLIFCFVPVVTGTDPFGLNRGYSVLWLLVLFILGTYIKKYYHTFQIKKGVLMGTFVGCVLVTCLAMAVSAVHPSINGMLLFEYTSPTIVIAAVSVVLMFSSMETSPLIRRIAGFCAPFSFSIYLLHEHPLVRNTFIRDKFVPVLSLPLIWQVAAVLLITVAIWAVCFALEYVRRCVFRFLKIDQFLQKMEAQLLELSSDPS